MESAREGSAEVAALPASFEGRPQEASAPTRGPVKRMARGLLTFALTGLTTMEVMAVAVAYVAVMGFLWMSGAARPERLISDPGFRTAWVIVALALVRPLTWVPFILPLAAFRYMTNALLGERRPIIRNAVAHLLTVGFLAGGLWLLAQVVEGAVTAVLSGLAFLTGSGSPSTLGSFRGEWNPARVAGVAAIVVVVRLILPPLDRDLGISSEPVLWFASGERGRFDRIALLAAVACSMVLVLVGALLGR